MSNLKLTEREVRAMARARATKQLTTRAMVYVAIGVALAVLGLNFGTPFNFLSPIGAIIATWFVSGYVHARKSAEDEMVAQWKADEATNASKTSAQVPPAEFPKRG